MRVAWERTGEPATDLELSFLLWEEAPGARKRRGFTNEEGIFRLKNLAPGRVLAWTAFGGRGSHSVVMGETTAIDIALPAGLTARGRVVDQDGNGTPGASLWLSATGIHLEGFVVGESGTDGYFELADLPESSSLGALAPGFAPSHLHPLRHYQARRVDSPDVELELVLNGIGGSLQVAVVGPSGEPVVGAWVQAVGSARGLELEKNGLVVHSTPPHEGWTDAAGRVELRGLAAGRPKLKVLARGLAPWTGDAQVTAGQPSRKLAKLSTECTVFGTVVGPDGEPAVGARIRQVTEHHDPLMPSAQVDAEGRYMLQGLPSEEVELEVTRQDLGRATTRLTPSSEESTRWDAQLSPGRVLAGRIVDCSDKSMQGWTVRAWLGSYTSWRAEVLSDRNGRFQIADCEPGTLTLELFRNASLERLPTLTSFVKEEDRGELLFRVGPADLCDSGLKIRLTSNDGMSLARSDVTVTPTDSERKLRAQTDANGAAEFNALPAGDYQISVHLKGGRHWPLGTYPIGNAEILDLGEVRIPSLGTLLVSVEAQAAHHTPPYFWISIHQRDSAGGLATPAVAHLEIADLGEPIQLEEGEYVLLARGTRGFASRAFTVTIRADAGVQAVELPASKGRPCRVGVQLSGEHGLPREVRLTVLDSQGFPIGSASVAPTGERMHSMDVNLGAGLFTLVAKASDGRHLRQEFRVPAPATADLEPGAAPFEVLMLLH